jgi:hypothetical protein
VNRQVVVAVAIVVVPFVAYVGLSLSDGAPRFPTRGECIRPPLEGNPVDVVFGRTEDPISAAELRDRVVSVGFVGVESVPDGCGRWKVVLEAVPDVEIAREVQEEAASVDLDTSLESSDG